MRMMQPIERFARFAERLGRKVYQDEQGAEGLEKLLIIAAVVLPLLIVLIFFKDAIMDWVYSGWEDVTSESTANPPTRPSAP